MTSRYEHTPDERRIRRAMGDMPSLCDAVRQADRRVGFRPGIVPVPIEIGDVAAYLEALAGALQAELRDHEAQRRELAALRSDLAAVRRVLGAGEEPRSRRPRRSRAPRDP